MFDLSKLLFGFNLVDFVFIHFIILMLIFAILIHGFEQRLPNALRQWIHYGQHSFRGEGNKLIALTECPKSWFKHFYVFAAAYAGLGLMLVLHVYIFGGEVPQIVIQYLDLIYGPKRTSRGKILQTLEDFILF